MTMTKKIIAIVVAVVLFIGLAAGIVSDISYGIIDPRIRMGAR